MNWKLAKTLFIIVFILVNIGLAIAYINKINSWKVFEEEKTTELDFDEENIQILNKLPDVDDVKMQLITGKTKDFESYAKSRSNVKLNHGDETIDVHMEHPIDFSEKEISPLKRYIDKHVYHGKDYQFKSSSKNRVVFEQTYSDYPIMNNSKALIIFKIDKDKRVKMFTQSYMGKVEPSEGANNVEKQVISPKKALDELYYNRYLISGDKVKNVRLGYYSFVREPSVQVLQPNWEVVIEADNETKTYYIEATSNNPKIIEQKE